MKKPGGEPALDHQSPKFGSSHKPFIEVQRVSIPGQFSIDTHVLGREGDAALCRLADVVVQCAAFLLSSKGIRVVLAATPRQPNRGGGAAQRQHPPNSDQRPEGKDNKRPLPADAGNKARDQANRE